MMIGKLLVYGTLRPGNPDRTRTINGFRMYDLGWYPGITISNDHNDSIVVEEIDVTDERHLTDLDMYEGFNPDNTANSLYLRKKFSDTTTEGLPVWVYIYNHLISEDQRVPDGDWLTYRNEKEGTNARLSKVKEAV